MCNSKLNYNNQSTTLLSLKETVQINITQLLCLMPYTFFFFNLKQESLHATQNLFWIVHLKVSTIANTCTLKGICRVLVLDP